MLTYSMDASTATITAVDHCRGVRWTVVYDPARDYWSAEQHSEDGRQRRYICARSGDDLATKVSAAEL